MSARCSEGSRRRLADERGSVLVLVAVGLTVVLLGSAFAVEFGRAYLEVLRLSRAVDAGALAAARVMRLGHDQAEQRAFAVAAANGVVDGQDGVALALDFTPNAAGQMTAVMTATRSLPLPLGRVMGREELSIASEAAAASPPVDLMMVIDQSGSLSANNAWDDLQEAADTFLGFFGAGYDQLGLVSFQTKAQRRERLRSDFQSAVRSRIYSMRSVGYTNMSHALELARDELRSSRVRPGSLKAVIFFTDGLTNTFTANWYGTPIVVNAAGNAMQVFAPLEDIPMNDWPWGQRIAACNGTCYGITPRNVLDWAEDATLARAEELREAGVYVYTIGLRDPQTGVDPDMELLRRMANQEGMEDPSQPQGKAYHAPQSSDLEEMFTRVASDLMVHLVR